MKISRHLVSVATLGACVCGAAPAWADYFPPANERPAAEPVAGTFQLGRAGAMRHDRGLYLRPQIGFGYLEAHSDKQTVSGLDMTFGFGIGASVADGLILHGQLSVSSAPDAQISNDEADVALADPSYALSVSSFGFGATYYTPTNVWIQGSIAPHVLTFSQSTRANSSNDTSSTDEEIDSQFGLGLRLGVGYEWWVSDEWALGLGVEGFGTKSPDWTSYGMATLFTATLN